MLYNFYIFNRQCQCVYYIEFQNRINISSSGGLKPGNTIDYFVWPEQVKSNLDKYYFPPHFEESKFLETCKLVYGTTASLKGLAIKIGGGMEDGMLSFNTDSYKLHYLETLTGLRFILNTDPNATFQKDCLKYIFENLYINYILKNPLSGLNNEEDNHGHNWNFNNKLFTENLVDAFTKFGLI